MRFVAMDMCLPDEAMVRGMTGNGIAEERRKKKSTFPFAQHRQDICSFQRSALGSRLVNPTKAIGMSEVEHVRGRKEGGMGGGWGSGW